jgi:hypothetical protein
MYYVCIENNQITTILNYQPNVPDTVSVTEITNEQYDQLVNNTHFFNVATNAVESLTNEQILAKSTFDQNSVHREFLNTTDWKVLRHMRQKALAAPTTLTDAEYLELEQQRQTAADSITE